MTVSVAQTKKLMKLGLSLFRRGFSSSKCKTAAKMAVARIKLLRNKRQAVVKQMRRDIALLLESKQDATARIRVEHVIREQNVLAANEFIELFCELIVSRLTIIAKQRECPVDLKEGIASVIFASPRCSEIPELAAMRNIFEKKYGKDFVSAATDLRPNSGVNRMLIEKLSVRTPPGEVKLKVMKEIAKEYQIDWDTTESEVELLKPPEERIEGPDVFVSTTSLPLKHKPPIQPVEPNKPAIRSASNGDRSTMRFEDTTSAAEAAAESAKQAIAAAQAAAHLASKGSKQFTQSSGFDEIPNASCNKPGSANLSGNSAGPFMSNYPPVSSENIDHQSKSPGGMFESHSFDRSHYLSHEERRPAHTESGNVYRRHSYNAPSAHSDIQFDESDCDEEIEMEEPPASIYQPPERPPPPVPSTLGKQDSVHHVHPKLPDYDDLAARFESLKYRKS
ncbi:IST1-like protein [Pistacia vera]|uniref:IST1-like protein n=1 Tax=Pistacia vera TaxID=55513 RepID=UPI00126354A0|nr:IST1-like protein [Pistacia vera]